MTEQETKPEYEETFFIVPRRIRKIPGLTLAFLDVYETIFQFWNKGLHCFLNNSTLQKRTGLGHTQVGEALIFFEKNKELERLFVGGRRYLSQPRAMIETDCSTEDPTAPAVPYRSSGTPPTASAVPPPTAPAVHNIKKGLNKEIECWGDTPSAHTKSSETQKEKTETTAFSDPVATSLFQTKFGGRNIEYQALFNECKTHYQEKSQWITPKRWLEWIKRENVDNHAKKTNAPAVGLALSQEEREKLQDEAHFRKVQEMEAAMLTRRRA